MPCGSRMGRGWKTSKDAQIGPQACNCSEAILSRPRQSPATTSPSAPPQVRQTCDMVRTISAWILVLFTPRCPWMARAAPDAAGDCFLLLRFCDQQQSDTGGRRA